ncbi:Ig-like domain-containing protein [Methanobacterium oryzae]|uniref:Ig-like domain-containing protein n=1 Tax=Methanobacterium oryzae TaxID=69540 RepID=UPI003D25BB2C
MLVLLLALILCGTASAVTLSQALDSTNLGFSGGWDVSTATSVYGGSSLYSGSSWSGNNLYSGEISGPGVLKFWLKGEITFEDCILTSESGGISTWTSYPIKLSTSTWKQYTFNIESGKHYFSWDNYPPPHTLGTFPGEGYLDRVQWIPTPDLTVQSITKPSTATSGSKIQVTDTVKNLYNANITKSFVVRYYLSNDTTFSTDDRMIGERTVNALKGWSTSSSSATVTLPSTIKTGNYYILSYVDRLNNVAEYSESNNVKSSSAIAITDIAPKAVKTDPYNGAVNVARNKVITITFNEPIKAGSMWVELKGSDGSTVPIYRIINGNTLTIKHSALLKPKTKYTVILHSGCIKDLTNNPVAFTTRSFTTGST